MWDVRRAECEKDTLNWWF